VYKSQFSEEKKGERCPYYLVPTCTSASLSQFHCEFFAWWRFHMAIQTEVVWMKSFQKFMVK